MKPWILATCFFISLLSSCAQSRYIKKVYAFSIQINPGAPPKYKNGVEVNRSQIKKFIYLECTGSSKPTINEVEYKGNLYKDPEIFFAGNEQIKAGINQSTGKVVLLSPAKGNRLWRIEITIAESEKNKTVSAKNNIVINGEKDGHPFTVKIDKEIELKPFIGS